MTIFRTDIEKALDEMISNEEGMRLQGLAVVLAKLKWPDLIACERKKDLGLDAHASALLAKDGVGRGLACSITNTYAKISGDAKAAKVEFPGLGVLIFTTPHKITNLTQKAWKADLRTEHDLELEFVTREDIITDLLLPANLSICASHLGLNIPLNETQEDLLAKAMEASKEIANAWSQQSRLQTGPLIDLLSESLDASGKRLDDYVRITELQHLLDESRRVIVEAPAGRGKTTTIIQLALDRANTGRLGILVDLPDWINSRADILDFVTRSPQFASRNISKTDLAALSRTVPLTFYLNGWNEIPERYSEDSVRALADLERNFPSAGIIVATRTHILRPPLPGAKAFRLRRVSQAQREEYLRKRLGSTADALTAKINSRRVLGDLTFTPRILAEVATLFELGEPIPDTKLGILSAIVALTERSPHHEPALRLPPVRGFAQEYLADLAGQMTSGFGVRLSEPVALQTCTMTSQRLLEANLISALPDSGKVLATLCAHHVLERTEYPAASYRFDHHQTQELLASRFLNRKLEELVRDGEEAKAFVSEFLNKTIWTEPIYMLVDGLKALLADPANKNDALARAELIVILTLEVDPIFAAELAYSLGAVTWAQVKGKVSSTLLQWNQSGSRQHIDCAAEAMLATGAPDFIDTITPILTSNSGHRVPVRDSHFHITSLGPDWLRSVLKWPDEQRRIAILNAMDSDETSFNIISVLAAEPIAQNKASYVEQIIWQGSADLLKQALEAIDDTTFFMVCRHIPAEELPKEFYARAIRVIRGQPRNDASFVEVTNLVSCASYGDTQAVEDIKVVLAGLSHKVMADDYIVLKNALDLISQTDRNWVSEWVMERMLSGSLYSEQWLEYLDGVSPSKRLALYQTLRDGQFLPGTDRAHLLLLERGADEPFARTVFDDLCAIRKGIVDPRSADARAQWDRYNRLESLLQKLPKAVSVKGMLQSVSGPFDDLQFAELAKFVGRIGREPNEYPEQLGPELAAKLRGYLKSGIGHTLALADYGGDQKQELIMALARVGQPSDLADLERMIDADIKRVTDGREAMIRGEHTEQTNGARMTQTSWNIHALEVLDAPGTEDLLVRLVKETVYETDAGNALIRRARVIIPPEHQFSQNLNYSALWRSRTSGLSILDEKTRKRYTDLIKAQIDELAANQAASPKPESFTGRLKGFAQQLAMLDGKDSAATVLKYWTVPGQWDGWGRVSALKALLERGVLLTTQQIDAVLEPLFAQVRKDKFWGDQNETLLSGALCVYPFASDPDEGVKRIKALIDEGKLRHYRLREIIAACGNSRSDACVHFLIDLEEDSANGVEHVGHDWIDAMILLDTSKSREKLLNLINPEAPQLKIGNSVSAHRSDKVIAYLARTAKEDASILERIFQYSTKPMTGQRRDLLAGVLGLIGTTDAILASLNLLDDQSGGPGYGLWHGIENFFVEHRPIEGSQYSFSLHPRDGNLVRKKLLDMAAYDQRRNKSAYDMLGEIELLRLRYGRANSELRHPNLESGIPWPVGTRKT